ncbi:MAG: DnaJ domain-containing protein, partial [Patescibacteria group bacterium]
TAAVVVTAVTCGIGGWAGVALASASGAIFGTIGNELGTVGSHYLGKAVYGDEFSNKTLLGKYLTDEKVYNPETGKYEEIQLSELTKIYGVQLLMGFLTTFALMGIGGQILGPYLSRFSSQYATAAGARGALAKLLNKIPRLSKREMDLLEQKGFNGMVKRIGMECLEETGEEGVETAAEKAHPALGFLASLYSCLNGRNVAYKLGKYKVVAEEAVNNNGEEALTTWSFDSRQTQEFTQKVQEEYGKQGFAVTIAENGEITVEKELALKNGKKARIKMVFKPSKESISMRQLFRESMEDGKSEIERLYGARSTGENTYEFDTLTPKGKISLVEYLRREGFVITGDPTKGEFEARKGEENITFKKSKTQKQSRSSDTQTEEDKKPDDETINKIPDPTLRQRVRGIVNDLWNKTHDYIADNFSKISGRWQEIREQVKQNSKELYEKIEARFSQLTKIIIKKKSAKDIFKDGKLIATADIIQMDVNFLTTLFYRAKDLGFARKLFGIEGELTAGKIKKAYKKLSFQFHPDRNGGSKQAGEMFKAIGGAKETLERALAEGKTGPVEESMDQDTGKKKETTWDKKTLDWINAQIKKIQDLQLKQKLDGVINGIETFTGKKWNQLVQTWGEISATVGKFNKQLKDTIDAGIKERQERKKRQDTNEQQKEQKKVEEIHNGEEVYVLRRSGTIEKGWVVLAQSEEGMTVYNRGKGTKFVLHNEVWTIKTIEARTETAATQISLGSEVYVKRSSGGIEKGWVVEGINPDGTYDLRTAGATRKGTTKDEIFTINEIE